MRVLLVAFLLLFGQSIPQGVSRHPAGGPFLSCSTATNTGNSTVNITTTGTADWKQWNSISTPESKATGGSQISAYTKVGGTWTEAMNGTAELRTLSWTDGTPDASMSSTNGIWTSRTINGQGFSFTCPAATASHSCIAYLQQYIGPSTLVVHLSDSSAADYTYNDANSGGKQSVTTTCNYQAASASQTLKFTWTQNSLGSQGVSIDGAAYQ